MGSFLIPLSPLIQTSSPWSPYFILTLVDFYFCTYLFTVRLAFLGNSLWADIMAYSPYMVSRAKTQVKKVRHSLLDSRQCKTESLLYLKFWYFIHCGYFRIHSDFFNDYIKILFTSITDIFGILLASVTSP